MSSSAAITSARRSVSRVGINWLTINGCMGGVPPTARPLIFAGAHSKDVDPFVLHIYAALAEQERKMISQRTRVGLQAAKARGVRLGTAGPALAAKNAAAAAKRDEALRSTLTSKRARF